MDDTRWNIWSIEHNAWWAPNEDGYTRLKAEAGTYTYDRAVEIVSGANKYRYGNEHTMEPNEAMILVENAN